MKMSSNHYVLYKWKNLFYKVSLENDFFYTNFQIHALAKDKFNAMFSISDIPKFMSVIATDDKYVSSSENLKNFISRVFENENTECFNAVFLYIVNGEIVGFLNTTINFEVAEVDYIFVRKELRKKGVSHFLMNIFINCANIISEIKINKISLEVGNTNIAAILFYKKFGFHEVGVRKKYYKNHEDALIMEKSL